MLTSLFAVVAITLLVSAMCSLFEATLYSTRIATLEAAREEGRNAAAAEHFLRLKRDIGVPTSAILILNTVANTTGATLAGMLAGEAFGSGLIGVFSAVLTIAILFLAEILPKTFGATHWKTLWPFVVWPLLAMERALRPIIWVTQAFASIFVRGRPSAITTQDEIVAMIRMGAESGEVTRTEHRLLRAVFRFDELTARDVMLPRRDVVCFDASWSFERCLALARETRHTRYPWCVGSLDDVEGMIHVKDLLGVAAPVELAALVRPVLSVPETMLIRDVLHTMQHRQPHMAAVVDEHGTTVGVITLEQIIEQLVGSVQDEFDGEEPDVVAAGPDTWIVRGSTRLDRLGERLGVALLAADVTTLSGLMVAELDHLPVVGDRVDLAGACLEVLEVHGRRAEKVKLTVVDPERIAEAEADLAAD